MLKQVSASHTSMLRDSTGLEIVQDDKEQLTISTPLTPALSLRERELVCAPTWE
jgi:hypothetical protein